MLQLATINARSGESQCQPTMAIPTWGIRTLVIVSRQLVYPGHNQPRDSSKRPGLRVVRHKPMTGVSAAVPGNRTPISEKHYRIGVLPPVRWRLLYSQSSLS